MKIVNDLKITTATAPYEFIVVDNNNNPIAFPIFATAAKLNLSPDLLSSLGENFSLFIYNDNGNERLGFSADIAKAAIFNTEIQKQEKTLPNDISLLFLDSTPTIPTAALFKDGSYGSFKTRYLNLNDQQTLSVDYVITNNKFVLGTSKGTEHAMLDKISQQSADATPQVQAVSNTDITTPQPISSVSSTSAAATPSPQPSTTTTSASLPAAN